MVHKDNKQVIATATPNGRGIAQLIPYAEHVEFLEAFCAECKNETLASFGSASGTPACRLHGVSEETPFHSSRIDSFAQ